MIGKIGSNINFTSVRVFKSNFFDKESGKQGNIPMYIYITGDAQGELATDLTPQKAPNINPKRIMSNQKEFPTIQDVRAELKDNEYLQLDCGNYWEVIANNILREAEITNNLRMEGKEVRLIDDFEPGLDIPSFLTNRSRK